MKQLTYISLVIFIVLCVNIDVWSQDSYSTSSGLIAFSTKIDNQPVKYMNNNLRVSLNYETAQIGFIVEKAGIRSDNDSLLKMFIPQVLEFKGKLGIDYINTGSHPVQEFAVEGTMETSSGRHQEINGKGTLSHLYSDNGISCLLNISFHLAQKDITGFILSSPPDGDLHVEIIQTVLDNHEY